MYWVASTNLCFISWSISWWLGGTEFKSKRACSTSSNSSFTFKNQSLTRSPFTCTRTCFQNLWSQISKMLTISRSIRGFLTRLITLLFRILASWPRLRLNKTLYGRYCSSSMNFKTNMRCNRKTKINLRNQVCFPLKSFWGCGPLRAKRPMT